MKKNSKISLIGGIVFFIVGMIIFLNPELLVKVVSSCIGGFLIVIGLYKSLNYYIQDKRFGVVNKNEIAFGITAVVLGIVLIFLADAIELLIRFMVGGWLFIIGLIKIVKTFYTNNRDAKYYGLLVIGIALTCIGLYIIFVSNLALSIIGLFMMIYGVIDFISYFVYAEKDETNLEENILTTIEDFVKDEIVEEVDFEEKENKEENTEEKKETKKRTKKKETQNKDTKKYTKSKSTTKKN